MSLHSAALFVVDRALSELEAGCAVLSQAQNAVAGIFKRILFFFAELRAPGVRDTFETGRSKPGANTATNGNSPMFTGKTILRYLHGEATKLNNDDLAASDANHDTNEHPVLEQSFEDIEVVIDHTAVNKIEDLHDCEYVEDICHLSARALIFLLFAPQGSAVPVRNTAWVDEGRIATISQGYVGLRVEVFSSEND